MADIAILVAEEYERRVKNMGYYSDVGSEAERERQISTYLRSVSGEKKAIAEDMLRNLNLGCVFHPKTNIGLAAFHGFFSA